MSTGGPALRPRGPAAHICGGRRGGSSCPAASDRRLLKPHVAESPAGCQRHGTSSSFPGLGGTRTEWIPTFTSFLVSLCFGSQLASHLAFLVLATGCGSCEGQSGLSP